MYLSKCLRFGVRLGAFNAGTRTFHRPATHKQLFRLCQPISTRLQFRSFRSPDVASNAHSDSDNFHAGGAILSCAALNTCTLRIRNVAFELVQSDLATVFDLKTEDVVLVRDSRKRKTGVAYLRFRSNEHAGAALDKQKQQQYEIANRPLVLSPVDEKYFNAANNCENEHTHDVMMCGIPFNATETDINEFFSPLLVLGTKWMRYHKESRKAQEQPRLAGKRTGLMIARFSTAADVDEALKRSEQAMYDRNVRVERVRN